MGKPTIIIHNQLLQQNGKFEINQRQLQQQPLKYEISWTSSTPPIKYNFNQIWYLPKYIIHLKKGGYLAFRQPPPVYLDENQYQGILAQSPITYLQNYQSGSPPRIFWNSSKSRGTYLNFSQQSSPQGQQNSNKKSKIDLHNQNHRVAQPEKNINHPPPSDGEMIQIKKSKLQYQQQQIHNQQFNPNTEGNISSSQQQVNSNKPQSQQQQQPEKPEQRQQSNISDKLKQEQPQQNDQQEIDQPPQLVPLPFPNLIDQLYNVSWRKRYVEEKYKYFLRDPEDKLERNYSIRSSSVKNQLSKICNDYIMVRGDGNCFYTAFGYQFLLILLTKYSTDQYNQFINEYKQKIEFKISYHDDFEIESVEDQQQISQFFYGTLEQLMKYPNNGLRKDELYRRFSAPFQVDDHVNGLFYGASTIFFRNLANYLVDFSELKDAIYDRVTLLKWEEECNCNEIIIQIFAQKLKIYIELLFFGDGKYILKEYGEGNPYKIMLLIKPGHYNIGLFEENPNKQE